MAGYCTLVLYFHSPAARENTTAHSCNIQPYSVPSHPSNNIYVSSSTFVPNLVCWARPSLAHAPPMQPDRLYLTHKYQYIRLLL